ncbi:BMP family ABC transporter substrate-binding protein [Candidatus Symbiobacter mobilis]|uniref:Sugar transporter substrate-binding protein n=1 Tax=Candidatus Symbiobacter mobilis CR TaxID=946483 RepID=U5N5J4_9BURK|nr:BMP family ABC transporter substrate-binding protein [Candidatus Symbiobacter mobilis]AGX86786.1 sugar transporter substrate-binding protein [Candidatus Symbiobacter mobilis CR]
MESENKVNRSRRELLAAGLSLAFAGCGPVQESAIPTPQRGAASFVGKRSAPLKIGFLYVGPVGDGGWSFAHDNARRIIDQEFGSQVLTSFVENVPQDQRAERVLQDLIGQGNRLIFGTSFGYMDAMARVAGRARDVRFEHATGYYRSRNMRTYDSRTYQGAYLAGIIAGAMTRNGHLGVVASIPIPEVIRNINSFTLGALTSNPNVITLVQWVNAWFDPRRETEAANKLMDSGADVLFQNTDSASVLRAAQARGKRAFGWDSDMRHYGPDAHLASSVVQWAPYYRQTVRDVLEGKWVGGGHTWWGVREGAIDIVSMAQDIPPATKERVQTVKKGLTEGGFSIWHGPILDNEGKLRLLPGVAASDKFLGAMRFYVQGVQGIVPSVE